MNYLRKYHNMIDNYELALHALISCKGSPYIPEKIKYYGSFLTYYKKIYTNLEQFTKKNDSLKYWSISQKSIYSKDPLIYYIFKARDVVEHGGDAPCNYSIVSDAKIGVKLFSSTKYAQDAWPLIDDHATKSWYFKLCNFKHRAGNIDVPHMHNNDHLESDDVEYCCELALMFAEKLCLYCKQYI